MKKAYVVIGANYGDEGKGLVTSYISNLLGSEAVVVRFNGGSQAGHTVVSPDGLRHVFGHFGSGTMNGCTTHLSKYFIANPVIFVKELKTLKSIGFNPKVTIDPNARVTTLYDMAINQLSERSLGRTASCGMGINETVERCETEEFGLTVDDLYEDYLEDKLIYIKQSWVNQRLKALKLHPEFVKTHSSLSQILTDEKYIARFMSDVKIFLENVLVIPDDYLIETENIIFEGAQGLLLDQDGSDFPYVTRSKTGLYNIRMDLADTCDITELETYYVSRCYMTRHGAGPLENEFECKNIERFSDITNIPNPHQGSLRFAPLDIANLLVRCGRENLESNVYSSTSLAITCLDQVPSGIPQGRIGGEKIKEKDFTQYMRNNVVGDLLLSYGPSWKDVRSIK